MKVTEEKITELEKKGFRRWQRNGMDRMYVNATTLGLTYTTYKTGNISSAQFDGVGISNSEARRMLDAKTYIDIVKSLIISGNATLANAAADLSGLDCEEHKSWDTIIRIA